MYTALPFTFYFLQTSTSDKFVERIERHVCGNSSQSSQILCWPKCCEAKHIFNVNTGRCQASNLALEAVFKPEIFTLIELNSTHAFANKSQGKFFDKFKFLNHANVTSISRFK